jgi:hypothetical protein
VDNHDVPDASVYRRQDGVRERPRFALSSPVETEAPRFPARAPYLESLATDAFIRGIERSFTVVAVLGLAGVLVAALSVGGSPRGAPPSDARPSVDRDPDAANPRKRIGRVPGSRCFEGCLDGAQPP